MLVLPDAAAPCAVGPVARDSCCLPMLPCNTPLPHRHHILTTKHAMATKRLTTLESMSTQATTCFNSHVPYGPAKLVDASCL